MSFKDIRKNEYHLETLTTENNEYMLIVNTISNIKHVLEKLPCLSSGLYYTRISAVESYHLIDQKSIIPNEFMIWHDRLGHPGCTMMRRIITNSHGHTLKGKKDAASQ